MHITGEGVWGEPPDRDAAIRVLRRAVELGVDLIDTADSYGPFVSEELIREALHTDGSDPYGEVTIDLYQLHRIDPEVPAEEQFGVLADLQREGKVRHLGLSDVAVGDLARPGGPLDDLARASGHTPAQLARSPVTLPIPGTSSVEHLEENVGAATITLDDDVRTELDELAG